MLQVQDDVERQKPLSLQSSQHRIAWHTEFGCANELHAVQSWRKLGACGTRCLSMSQTLTLPGAGEEETSHEHMQASSAYQRGKGRASDDVLPEGDGEC